MKLFGFPISISILFASLSHSSYSITVIPKQLIQGTNLFSLMYRPSSGDKNMSQKWFRHGSQDFGENGVITKRDNSMNLEKERNSYLNDVVKNQG